jgi:exodeoxyribonuclease III
MRIATWNVNSIRTRLDQLGGWLARAAPDVVCLQETKVEDERFPTDAINELGYQSAICGQKSYNGVAILARFGLTIDDVRRNLEGDEPTSHKRLIAATIEGVRIVNVYVPNGQAVGTEAFAYKLAWLRRLRDDLAKAHTPEQDLFVCGDFNVAPATIDVHDPKKWEGQILCHPDERAALKHLMDWGLVDIFRERHPEPKHYSWWDYRMGAFKRNAGLRIDLALVTKPLAARCKDAWIDKAPRELERPSDHTPVVVEIAS